MGTTRPANPFPCGSAAWAPIATTVSQFHGFTARSLLFAVLHSFTVSQRNLFFAPCLTVAQPLVEKRGVGVVELRINRFII